MIIALIFLKKISQNCVT